MELRRWSVEERSRNVHIIRVSFDQNKDWEQWVLLSSDRHWDNPHSDHNLQRRHLELAKERDAPIIDCGDLFDAMGGRNDRRGTKSGIRPEHQSDDYFDSIVDTAVKFFTPYADLFAVIARGNHDTAILKHNETDLTRRFVDKLNSATGASVFMGGYSGYVRFQFTGSGNVRKSVNLKYHHGHGGGGPVTKGVIHTNRRAVYLPDASIIISGHHHESFFLEMQRERLLDSGRIVTDTQTHVSIPTYKREYVDGFGGWHVERGAGPTPVGAMWLRWHWDKAEAKMKYDISKAS